MFTGKVLYFLQSAFAHYLAFDMIIFSFFYTRHNTDPKKFKWALLGNACLMVNNYSLTKFFFIEKKKERLFGIGLSRISYYSIFTVIFTFFSLNVVY